MKNTHTQTYKIKGMHCASCASIIENTFKKTEGVKSAEVNYGTEAVKIAFDDKKINLEDFDKNSYNMTCACRQDDIKVENFERLGLVIDYAYSLIIILFHDWF